MQRRSRMFSWMSALMVAAGSAVAQETPAAPPATSLATPQTLPQPPAPDNAPPVGLTTIFPSVRIDRAQRLLEIDGEVPIDVNSKETPTTFLEVMVCTPDTKEHESLVMTRAKAAHVHAALLLLGLEPGKPGSWSFDPKTRRMTQTPPTGPRLNVFVVTKDADGKEQETLLSDWVINERDSRTLTSTVTEQSSGMWVFAGSREKMIEGQNVYKADADGTLIGLTTFGFETIAWRGVYSPESSVQEPEWIADKAKVPPTGTKVVVRVRAVAEAK